MLYNVYSFFTAYKIILQQTYVHYIIIYLMHFVNYIEHFKGDELAAMCCGLYLIVHSVAFVLCSLGTNGEGMYVGT